MEKRERGTRLNKVSWLDANKYEEGNTRIKNFSTDKQCGCVSKFFDNNFISGMKKARNVGFIEYFVLNPLSGMQNLSRMTFFAFLMFACRRFEESVPTLMEEMFEIFVITINFDRIFQTRPLKNTFELRSVYLLI